MEATDNAQEDAQAKLLKGTESTTEQDNQNKISN